MKSLNPKLFFHWPGVKKAGQDKAQKALNHVNTEYNKGKGKVPLITFLPPCMFWFINNIPRAMWSVHLGKIKPVRLPLLPVFENEMKSLSLCVNLNLKPFFTLDPLRTYTPVSENVKPFSLHGFKLMLGHFLFLFLLLVLSYLFCFVNTSFDIDMKCQTFTNALVFLFCLFWFSTTDIVI